MTLFSVKFSCLLRAAKNGRGVPGLLWHEYRPQELRRLNKYRPTSPHRARGKNYELFDNSARSPWIFPFPVVWCVADKEAT